MVVGIGALYCEIGFLKWGNIRLPQLDKITVWYSFAVREH